MAGEARPLNIAVMENEKPHMPLCTIELIAEGHAERCPGAGCAFWSDGCVLARVEAELDGRPDVAKLLLDLRSEIESGRDVEIREAQALFDKRLAAGSE